VVVAGRGRRGARTVRDLARVALVRAPRGPLLSRLASGILDAAFEASSPLPCLPPPASAGRDLLVVPAPGAVAPGNQSIEGVACLVALAEATRAERIFEIGTYNGLTALALAANLPHVRIDTLDLPPDLVPELPLAESDELHLSRAASRRYEGRPEADRITQHLGDSARFDFSPFAGAIDLVYVDGAHSREYVENDTNAAFRMVKPDGAIVWDDYSRLVPDVPALLHGLAGVPLHRVRSTRLVVWLGGELRRRLQAGTLW